MKDPNQFDYGTLFRERRNEMHDLVARLCEFGGKASFRGRLIKRPIVTDGKKVTVGYKEEEFKGTWGK